MSPPVRAAASQRVFSVLATALAAVAGAGEGPAPSGGSEALPAMDCLLEPRMIVSVSSPVPGVLERLPVDRGDGVREGTVIAELHSRAEEAALEVAMARAEFGKRTDERNEELYRDELISIHEKDQSATESLLAELEARQATVLLEMRTIRSPIDGTVVERFKSPGEYVHGDEIMKIAQIDPLNVEVIVPVAHFGKVTVGQRARIVPEAPVGGIHKARVTVVDSIVDAASSTFGVRLELPNPDGRIPAGLRCTVEFLPAE